MVWPLPAKKFLEEISQKVETAYLSLALEATDPDPYAHQKEVVDYQQQMEEFRSVAFLACPKERPAQKNHDLYLVAEGFEAQVRALSVSDLLTKLQTLEKKAFHYDPQTKEATIADFQAHLTLKNYIRAIERAAFEDKDFLKKIDLPEIKRLSILLAEELIPQDRGLIYQVERESLGSDRFEVYLWALGEEFFKNYDGKSLPWNNPLARRQNFLGNYGSLHWSENEYLSIEQKFSQEHATETRNLLLKRLTPEELDEISKMDEEALWKKYTDSQKEFALTKDPEKKIRALFNLDAISQKLISEAKDIKELNKLMMKKMLEANPFYRFDIVKPWMDQMVSPLSAGQNAFVTVTRLDNYEARWEFLDVARGVIEKNLEPLKAVAATSKSFSPHALAQSNLFNLLTGFYIFVAQNQKIPFSPFDFLDLVDEKSHGEIGQLLGGEAIDHPLSWEEVESRGTVRVNIATYPTTDKWYENEWEILKRIDYKGCSVFDLASSVVDTVTLSPSISNEETKSTTLGTAQAFFKNIFVSYRHIDTKKISHSRRLGIVAHEVFHNMEKLRFYSGFGAGTTLPVLRERNAYFFQATVLEEYLKLRWQEREETPLSKKEIEELLKLIIEARLNGLEGNAVASQLDPEFDWQDRRIELPLPVENSVEKAATETMKDPARKEEIQKLMRKHPGRDQTDFWMFRTAAVWFRKHPQSKTLPTNEKRVGALFSKAMNLFYKEELSKIADGLFKDFDIGEPVKK